MELYPLIEIKKTEQPPLWVYNNYAYVYHQYLESYKKDTMYYVMGDYQKKPKLDESLEIELSNNQNLKGISFIKNESFEWVEQTYYKHLAELEFIFVHDWIYSDCAINCFSALYDLKKNEIPWDNDEISNIKIYDFKSSGIYPISEQLDLLVRDKLKNIEPDLSFREESELREKGYHLTKDKIYSFFQFHLNSCEGDIYDFVNHSIELTKEVWSKGNPKNTKRNQYFESWLNQTIDEYNLDRSKLKLEQKNVSEIPENQDLKVFDKMEKLCPLIKFQDIRKPSFWVYNNLSTVLNSYKEKFGNYLSTKYFLGEVEKGFSCFCYLDVYEYSNYKVEFSNNQKLKNNTPWKYNVLNSLAIDVLISTYNATNDKVQSAVLYGGDGKFTYPDPKELDLAVKDRLKEIEPDFSRSDLNDINLQLLKCENNVDAFFTFHFKEYQGEDPHDFVNHSIELTKEVWNGKQPKNTDRKKCFDNWIESKINDGYLDRSKLKLEQNITSKITNKEEELNISELNALSPESYYDRDLGLVPSPLYLNLNNRLENSKNAYDTISKLSKGIKEYWGDSFEDIKRKNVFNEWLNNVIKEHNLDRSKLGLEPDTTPEPPQVQQNENIVQPLVKIRWNAPKNVLTSIFVQLKQMNTNHNSPVIDNSYEDIALFLKTNFDCYQDTEISTITTTLKSQSGGNNTPSTKKLIEIRKSDL